MNTMPEQATTETAENREVLETTARLSIMSALVAGLIYCISLLA